jgi:lysophospholipase L1-like esterase
VSVLVLAAAAGTAGAAIRPTYYVSLGDSLAQGYQPIGGPRTHAVLPIYGYGQGYADQLFKLERGRYTQLQLVKLGCGGESTSRCSTEVRTPTSPRAADLRPSTPLDYPSGGTQLAEATAFLEAHRGSVAFVTLNLGANDVTGPSGIVPIFSNLPLILASLRAAAGPGVPIVGMNYYDPFVPQAWSDGGLPAVQAEVAGVVAFNDVLESAYAAAGDPIADVESAFSVTDLTLVDGTPLSVLRECQWTWICTPPPLGPDIHANSTGYGVIAQAFADQLTP